VFECKNAFHLGKGRFLDVFPGSTFLYADSWRHHIMLRLKIPPNVGFLPLMGDKGKERKGRVII